MKQKNVAGLLALVAVLTVSMLFGGYMFGHNAAFREIALQAIGEKYTPIDSTPRGSTPSVTTLGTCPDDGDTSFTLDVKNILNDTGAELYDVTVYLLADDGSIIKTITDTTSPTAVTIDCGYEYTLKAVAADGASGDSSNMLNVYQKPQNSEVDVNSDGTVTFSADRSNFGLGVNMKQHGTLSFKLYDNNDARYAYDDGDATNTDYETTGVVFRDGDNATAFVIGSGDYLDFKAKVKGVETDTDAMDSYVLIAIKADIAKWDEPQVRWNSALLSETTLNTDETKALKDYDFVYKITSDILDNIHDIDFYMDVLSGQNPTADVEIDFFTAGNYLSTDSTCIKTATHKDNPSRTAVYTLQGFDIDVS